MVMTTANSVRSRKSLGAIKIGIMSMEICTIFKPRSRAIDAVSSYHLMLRHRQNGDVCSDQKDCQVVERGGYSAQLLLRGYNVSTQHWRACGNILGS